MKKLKLIDGVFLVAGSMIGSGIFIVSADISRLTAGGGWLLLSWILAGLITLLGALSFAELAAMFPKAGGQYIYLKEAYNPITAFLYGWTIFMVVQCGTIAAVAVAFSKYFGEIVPFFSEKNIALDIGITTISTAQLLGIAMIALLTFINSKGIQYGQIIIRLFTSAKLLSLLFLIILGAFVFRDQHIWELNMANFWNMQQVTLKDGVAQITNLTTIALFAAIGMGMVGSLFSCDAWNNVSFIAGEIENPQKNLPKSLVYGVGIVISLYLLVNIAYLNVLPLQGDPNGVSELEKGMQFAAQDRVGTAAATMMFGKVATIIMALLIIVSTFGCNNGIILMSARVYQAMAKDGLFFEKMKFNNANDVPGFALWVQFIWASILCLSGKYGQLLDYVMFAVMLFYILAIAAVFVLRSKQPDTPRPYKVWMYPIVPTLYLILASAFTINLLINKPEYCIPSLIIVLLGIPIFYFWKRKAAINN